MPGSASGIASVPCFLYGTAWKEDRTQCLTELALERGFRGIDTANQRRHYHEVAVGDAIAAAIGRGLVSRGELFLQSKFTFQRGQDHRLPYDPGGPIPKQVEQSFASSLEHLQVDTLESYLLHGPTQASGLTTDDWLAWSTMEILHAGGRAGKLGISNVNFEQLEELCHRRWDSSPASCKIGARCKAGIVVFENSSRLGGIVYQGFSLLTANPHVVSHAAVNAIAKHHQKTPAQIVFRFAVQVGIVLIDRHVGRQPYAGGSRRAPFLSRSPGGRTNRPAQRQVMRE